MEIAAYIARDNIERAFSYVDELEALCDKIGDMPGMGVARSELEPGLQMLPHQNYNIYYRSQTAGVRIERIIHSARAIDSDDFSRIH